MNDSPWQDRLWYRGLVFSHPRRRWPSRWCRASPPSSVHRRRPRRGSTSSPSPCSRSSCSACATGIYGSRRLGANRPPHRRRRGRGAPEGGRAPLEAAKPPSPRCAPSSTTALAAARRGHRGRDANAAADGVRASTPSSTSTSATCARAPRGSTSRPSASPCSSPWASGPSSSRPSRSRRRRCTRRSAWGTTSSSTSSSTGPWCPSRRRLFQGRARARRGGGVRLPHRPQQGLHQARGGPPRRPGVGARGRLGRGQRPPPRPLRDRSVARRRRRGRVAHRAAPAAALSRVARQLPLPHPAPATRPSASDPRRPLRARALHRARGAASS
jgi:hypothetical protein